ncbi:MAG TPA: vanadium-dependent haloperoxidase [Saprospiraceae bacterium]|nr:vanadium-dependent haloperoxidase [Saprospiraceae bacterium]
MRKLLYLLVIVVFAACEREVTFIDTRPPADFSYIVPLQWNELFTDLERFTAGYRPPVSGRTSGIIGLIAYETVVPGFPDRYKSIAHIYEGLSISPPARNEEIDWEIALHAAYETAFTHMFPTAPAAQQFKIRDLVNTNNKIYQSRVAPEVFFRSSEWGRYVANEVYGWSVRDRWGHQAFLKNNDPDYFPPLGAQMWQPTYPDYSEALLPHWGKAYTFAANNSDVVPPPHEFTTTPGTILYEEARVVLELVNEIKAGQHAEDKWIAEFWSDDCPTLTLTPSARFISITSQLVQLERLDLMDAVFIYAKVGMGLNDAGVRCWGEKYKYNYLRPIDYIRRHMGQENWNTIMCPDGSGNYFTPNFPAYPSGHATFGAVATEILEDFFGTNYSFTDRTHQGRTEFNGTPRRFNRLKDMAYENAYSRIPLGVHFQMDADAGVDLGFRIGQKINNLPWR